MKPLEQRIQEFNEKNTELIKKLGLPPNGQEKAKVKK